MSLDTVRQKIDQLEPLTQADKYELLDAIADHKREMVLILKRFREICDECTNILDGHRSARGKTSRGSDV